MYDGNWRVLIIDDDNEVRSFLAARLDRLLVRQRTTGPPEGNPPVAGGGATRKLPARVGSTVTFIPVEDVCYVRASGKYLTDCSLKEIEQEVQPPARLFRIHLSWLVNLDRVSRVFRESQGRYAVEVTDDGGTVLYVSQRRARGFREALGLHV